MLPLGFSSTEIVYSPLIERVYVKGITANAEFKKVVESIKPFNRGFASRTLCCNELENRLRRNSIERLKTLKK